MSWSAFIKAIKLLLAFVMVLMILITAALNSTQVRQGVLEAVERAAGGKISVGDIGARWKFQPEFVLENLVITNPRWQGQHRKNHDILRVENASLVVSMRSLLVGELQVKQLTLDRPVLTA